MLLGEVVDCTNASCVNVWLCRGDTSFRSGSERSISNTVLRLPQLLGSHGNLHALLGKGFPELREYCVACAFPKGLAHTEDSQNSEDTNEPIWHQSTCFLEPCELLS